MQHPTKIFDEWATLGKDKGMEISHAASVSEILDYAISRIKTESSYFSFLDNCILLFIFFELELT